MPDPVSWFVIEPGWEVVDAHGKRLGTADEVIGDLAADIFDGVTVATGRLGRPRYVPAERVAAIYEGRVELDIDREAFEQLPLWEGTPPSVDELPPGATRR